MVQFDNSDWGKLLDYTEDSLIIIDRDLRIVACNQHFRDYYKLLFNTDIKIGDDILNYAVDGRKDALRKIYSQIFEGQRFEYEIEIDNPNGGKSFYHLVYKPAKDDAGNIIAALVFATDTTNVMLARAEIENSEKRFKTLVENSVDAIAILTPDGTPSYVSPSIATVLGYSHEEAMELQLFNLLHPDDIQEVAQTMQLAVENPRKPIPGAAARVRHKDGTYRWCDSTITNMIDDPLIGGIVDNFRDVTYRYYRTLEEEFRSRLLMSHSELLSLSDSLADILKHAVFLLNAKVGEVWLKSRSKPILYKASEWVSDDSYGKFLSLHDIRFSKGEGLPGLVWQNLDTVRFEELNDAAVFKHRDIITDAGFNLALGVPILNDGVLIGVLTLFSDTIEPDYALRLEILERLSPFIGLEIARKQSQRDLDHFISRTPVIIGTLGDDGYFKQVNPGLVLSSGYTEEELLSNPFIAFVHPDDLELTRIEYEKLISGQEDRAAFINRYITKTGSTKWTAWHTSPIPGEDGLFFTFGNDITELLESRESLEDLNDNLKERNKELALMNDELEQFVYIASHDLQEPLRMITSFLSLLEKRIADNLDDKSKQYIFFATDGAVRMRSLILDLLKYSRVGREVTLKEFVDLNTLLKEVVNLNLPLLNEHNANISIGHLPSVYGIKSALFQVFQNLIQNSVKYRKQGLSPQISIEGEEFDSYWKFSVKDNGIGIDERYFDKIFIIFQRLHTREEYSGTGIGLAICKKIVDHHKGKIWLESVVGVGSTFYFTIAKDQI